jgi:hypothetical protein
MTTPTMTSEHYREEHHRLLATIPEAARARAVDVLRDLFRTYPDADVRVMRGVIAADPNEWVVPYHFGWGMGIRNHLRQHGCGEAALGVANLDDVYALLVEQALDTL